MSGDLVDLLARVKAAEGPDRELDASLGFAMAGWERFDWRGQEWFSADGVQYPWPPRPGQNYPDYTTSLDAALALVERVLPGAVLHLFIFRSSTTCDLYPDEDSDGFKATCRTASLALLAALLKALIAQGVRP